MNSTDQECPICYDIIGVNNCCTTECGHSFCLKCILNATQNNHRCPFCRSEILELRNQNEDNGIEDDDEDAEEEEEEDQNEDGETVVYKVDVSKLAQIYRDKEYTYEDLLAIIVEFKFYSVENQTGKYTEEYFDQFHNEVEEIIECDLQERATYEKELILMRKEDTRSIEHSRIIQNPSAVADEDSLSINL